MVERASTSEVCVNCGRSTAVGTPHFVGRRVIPPDPDDTAAESSYLCEECQDQIYAAAREARLSDEELRATIKSGEIPGTTYEGVGPMAGFTPGAGGFGPGG